MTVDFLNKRKGLVEHHHQTKRILDELKAPLANLNLTDIGYCKFYLDKDQYSNKGKFIHSNSPYLEWACSYVERNGSEYIRTIRNTKLGDTSYFLLPTNTDDFTISANRQLFGMTAGICIYKRFDDYLEGWDLTTTLDDSILSTNAITDQSIHTLLKYVEHITPQIQALIHHNPPPFFETAFPEDYSYIKKDFRMDDFLKMLASNAQFQLSDRECVCLNLIGQGKTVKEIATALDLSIHTISSYINALKNKTGCHFKTDLVKLYHQGKEH